MTTPGGVPNLPTGALTLDTLAEKLQDLTGAAFHNRAVERFPNIFNGSTGGNPVIELTPLGILTRIWAEINSIIANADPADIQGPEDLPELFLEFIEGLPVIGQLIGLLEAILGTYSGDDEVLLAVQAIFDPIRRLLQMVAGIIGDGFPTLAEVEAGWAGVVGALGDFLSGDWQSLLDNLVDGLSGQAIGTTVGAELGDVFDSLDDFFGDTGVFAATSTKIQELIDAIWQAITGVSNVDNLIDDVFNALQNIPGLNILGLGGPADIWSSLQTTWDQLISGFVNVIDTGSSLADLFNVGNIIGSGAFLGSSSWDILGIRNNKPMYTGMLPTSDSTLPLSQISGGGSAPTIAVTQTTATIGFKRFQEATAVGVVSWLGSGVTSITQFYVLIWKLLPDETLTLLHWSPDIIADVSSAMAFNIYELATPLEVEAGDVLGFELAPVGSGTHSVAGQTSWLPVHPHTIPRKMAARRDATIAPPANFLDISDDFATQDTAKWLYPTGASATSGQLRLTAANSPHNTSVQSFDFTSGVSQVITEAVQMTTGASYAGFGLVNSADPSDAEVLVWNNGDLYFAEYINGVLSETHIAYNSTTHRCWRIRYEGGQICWDTSPDAFSWTNRRAKTPGAITLTSVKVIFYTDVGSGSGTALFDNLNLIPAAGITYSSDIPFIEVAVDVGPGSTFHAPQTVPFNDDGTIVIPSWVVHIDPVAVGAGAGGSDGGAVFPAQYGKGGNAGGWGWDTWNVGTDFTPGDIVTVSIGAAGVNSGSNGTGGGATTITVNGNTVTGSGSSSTSGTWPDASNSYGRSPGNLTYQDVPYAGGAQQNTLGAAGAPPGGGGAGGATHAGNGGAGSNGYAWLRFYQ